MKVSPYVKYARLKLIEENKFDVLQVGGQKIKIYDPRDWWTKILEFQTLCKKEGIIK